MWRRRRGRCRGSPRAVRRRARGPCARCAPCSTSRSRCRRQTPTPLSAHTTGLPSCSIRLPARFERSDVDVPCAGLSMRGQEVDVGAGHERLGAEPGQHDGRDARVGVQGDEVLVQLCEHVVVEGVEHARPSDGEHGNVANVAAQHVADAERIAVAALAGEAAWNVESGVPRRVCLDEPARFTHSELVHELEGRPHGEPRFDRDFEVGEGDDPAVEDLPHEAEVRTEHFVPDPRAPARARARLVRRARARPMASPPPWRPSSTSASATTTRASTSFHRARGW